MRCVALLCFALRCVFFFFSSAGQPLSGVVAYVDACLDDGSSMRAEYGKCLGRLGADVRSRLPKNMETLTHLVWKDGSEGARFDGGRKGTCVDVRCKAVAADRL